LKRTLIAQSLGKKRLV